MHIGLIFLFRAWGKKEDYWTLYWSIMEKVKLEFDKEGIEIPYPNRDITLT